MNENDEKVNDTSRIIANHMQHLSNDAKSNFGIFIILILLIIIHHIKRDLNN